MDNSDSESVTPSMTSTRVADEMTSSTTSLSSLSLSSSRTERFTSLLESATGSDFSILAGKDEIAIPAHKLILMVASPVIRNVLEASPETKTLKMPILEPGQVKVLLKFMYTGEKPEDVALAVPLLKAAEAYDMPDLADHCAMLLETKLSDTSAIGLYEQALLYKNEYLQKAAMAHISTNAAKIVELNQFLEISAETLEKLLEKDHLEVFDELQLFNAVMRWAHAELGRQRMGISTKYLRSVLEKVIHLIRFPSMTPAEFSLKVATAQVLTTDEIVTVLLYFNIPAEHRLQTPPGVFNSAPRKYYAPKGEPYTVERCHQIIDDMNYSRTTTCRFSCSTKLRVDSQIWIHNVGVILNQDGYNTFQVRKTDIFKLKIVDSFGNVVGRGSTTGICANHVSGLTTVAFNPRCCIKNDGWYSLEFKLNSAIAYSRRYGGLPEGRLIDKECITEEGGIRTIVFEFEDGEEKPFFGKLDLDFSVY